MFEGQEGYKFFSHNVEKLEDQQYKLAGSLVAMSVLHDGPGMSFIHPTVYDLMTNLDVSLENFNIDLIPDEECRTAVKEVSILVILKIFYAEVRIHERMSHLANIWSI